MEKYIGLIATFLGFIIIILKLILYVKQIKRENNLAQKQLIEESEKQKKILESEKERSEILEITMKAVKTFLENELNKFIKKKDLISFDEKLRNYISEKLKVIGDGQNVKTKLKIEKTLKESLGIDINGQTFEPGGFNLFLDDRAKRRIEKYIKDNQ